MARATHGGDERRSSERVRRHGGGPRCAPPPGAVVLGPVDIDAPLLQELAADLCTQRIVEVEVGRLARGDRLTAAGAGGDRVPSPPASQVSRWVGRAALGLLAVCLAASIFTTCAVGAFVIVRAALEGGLR